MSRLVANGLNLANQRITALADPSSATDAATKQYVDNFVNGLAFKEEVRVATTANGTLATAYENGDSVDGVTLATGDRILLKNQSAGAENGVYVVAASGAPTRATDADSTTDLNQATVKVRLGTVNANTQWTQTADSPTVGTTPLTWVSSAAATTYVAGAGLTESPALTFNVGAGTGITVAADTVSVDSTWSGLIKRYAAAIGDGSTTAITVTHNLGTRDVVVSVHDAATFEEIYPDINKATTNTVTVTFAAAPASSAYRVVVLA